MADAQFYRHMPVYLNGGRLLGRTEEVSHAGDWIHVRQGILLVRDWYIPSTAIASIETGGVRLTVGRQELLRARYNVPPEPYLAQQGATPGYEYTAAAGTTTDGDR